MTAPMKFPKGVVRCKRPKMTNHRGRTWDSADLTLPNGNIVVAYLDTTWGTRFYFGLDYIWRSAPIDEFERGVGRTLRFDMRDRQLLDHFEQHALPAFERLVQTGEVAEIREMLNAVNEAAGLVGFNDDARLYLLRAKAEQRCFELERSQ